MGELDWAYRLRYAGGRMGGLRGRVIASVREEAGQDVLEYALILALLALGTIATTKSLAGRIGGALTTIGSTLTSNV